MEEIVYQGISREEILLMKRLLTEMKNNLLNSKDFKGVDMDTIIEKTCPSARGSFSNRIYRRNWIGQIRSLYIDMNAERKDIRKWENYLSF